MMQTCRRRAGRRRGRSRPRTPGGRPRSAIRRERADHVVGLVALDRQSCGSRTPRRAARSRAAAGAGGRASASGAPCSRRRLEPARSACSSHATSTVARPVVGMSSRISMLARPSSAFVGKAFDGLRAPRAARRTRGTRARCRRPGRRRTAWPGASSRFRSFGWSCLTVATVRSVSEGMVGPAIGFAARWRPPTRPPPTASRSASSSRPWRGRSRRSQQRSARPTATSARSTSCGSRARAACAT